MHVVATAGHVDHGKSTLVRALTGMEPDRWAEERRRGLTIDLGFVWAEFPGVGQIAFVDVPGHERFVTNMLAGIGPAPAVLLVVAADEGWMPQSAEHLRALDALGISHGVLAVTRGDLAEPELAIEEAQSHLEGTSLAGIPSVAVSGTTGAGIDDLRDALTRLVVGLPSPDPTAPVRLWIDRSFTMEGAGTVVTGTLSGGSLATGDTLTTREGRQVQVRGIHSLGRSERRVDAVARVAVNLRNVDHRSVRRGEALLTPDAWELTGVVDVALRSAVDSSPSQLTIHIGAAAETCAVRPLGPSHLRLTFPDPLPLRVGDVAILRDPGRRQIVAGATVVDVHPPALRRRGAAAQRATQLESVASTMDLALALLRRGPRRPAELARMGLPVPTELLDGEWCVDPSWTKERAAALAELKEAWTAEHRLDPGLPASVAAQRLDLGEAAILRGVLDAADLSAVDGWIRPADDVPALPPDVDAAVAAVEEDLRAHPFQAPDADRLAALGLGRGELTAAVRVGRLRTLPGQVVLLPDALDRAIEILRALPQPFTVSAARQALDTSRRVALPLLAELDSTRRTRRDPDSNRTVR